MIYLVTPTLETINLILRDFANPKKPRYGDVHLFFLSKVRLKQTRELKRVSAAAYNAHEAANPAPTTPKQPSIGR